jgi:hypothetical protein
VDPDHSGKWVGENNTQLLPWHRFGDDESILLIVTSIVHTIMLSIVNCAIDSLPDPSRMISELWGCQEERNRECGGHACNVAPICDNSTSAQWAMLATPWSNPIHFCFIYHSEQANGTAGAQIAMHGGRSNLPLDDILSPPAKDTIEDNGVKLDDDGQTRCSNLRSYRMMKSGFEKFEQNST